MLVCKYLLYHYISLQRNSMACCVQRMEIQSNVAWKSKKQWLHNNICFRELPRNKHYKKPSASFRDCSPVPFSKFCVTILHIIISKTNDAAQMWFSELQRQLQSRCSSDLPLPLHCCSQWFCKPVTQGDDTSKGQAAKTHRNELFAAEIILDNYSDFDCV